MKRLLIVDDEATIVKGLVYSLEADGYITDAAYDGLEALEKIQAADYDLILLDVMLPGISGIEICQRVREFSNVPILMLTAKGEDMDKILGLEYGADDYMTKPFNILEVKARIRTILRRTTPDQNVKALRVRGLQLLPERRSASLDGRDVNLTATEYDLLELLMNNRGKVFSREELLAEVWSDNYDGDERTIDVHIRRLREKIEPNPKNPEFIQTKWRVGYYFSEK